MPLASVAGREVRTVEGVAEKTIAKQRGDWEGLPRRKRLAVHGEEILFDSTSELTEARALAWDRIMKKGRELKRENNPKKTDLAKSAAHLIGAFASALMGG